jgi:glycosyltransferase involved in cell wall biosynthesis
LPVPAIAFDVTPLQNAHAFRGIGTYVRGLATRLLAQSDVPIEFWGWRGNEPFAARPPHTTLWLGRPPMPRYRGAWVFAQLAMRARARRSTAPTVHITDPDALIALGHRRMLTTVYDLIPLKQGIGRKQVIARAGYRSYLAAVKRSDVVFAISQQTAGDLVELLRIPASRIVVARPGVDMAENRSVPTARGRPYFLFVGGPNPNKNLSTLLDAMQLCPELSEELVVAGHWLPKQIAALEKEIANGPLRGRVRHVGFVPESRVAGLMRDATALVVPSLHEGFGLPVAEGMAAGALVIHSHLPVLEETSAGAALTFDPRSARSLAASLRTASGDAELGARLRRAGVERARALTWDAAVAATLVVYEGVKAS